MAKFVPQFNSLTRRQALALQRAAGFTGSKAGPV
jgi:hypothetical protein